MPLDGETEARIVGRPIKLGSLSAIPAGEELGRDQSGCPRERIGALEWISLLLILILPLVMKFLVVEFIT